MTHRSRLWGRRSLHVVAVTVGFTAPVTLSAQNIAAMRTPPGRLRLDGLLSEETWRVAPAAQGFVQREPVEGEPAPEATEVRFAYDDDALWVGARMYSRASREIRALVTRRDRESNSEQLAVSLDTYRDRRTAYTFAVTAAGVRIDYYHAADFEDERDFGFDPVWEAKTVIDSLGWTAELRIPFAQLRFNDGAEQQWGVNLVRRVPARNEASYWVLVPRRETGWSSRMGTLGGIGAIRSSHRIEAIPYAATVARVTRTIEPANPFSRHRDVGVRAGGDLKLGLGPSLTLDMTLNPDFGQVEADPAEVNLTAYETFFEERRPFFVDDGGLFNTRGLFYSRRIGAPPPGASNADFAERRENTTILGAAKLTGRITPSLGVVALAAVTDRERVATFDTASRQRGHDVVAPLTTWVLAGVQQQFGEDASTLNAMVTSVQRDIPAGSALEPVVSRSASSALLDGRWRWADGAYDLSAYLGFATVRGDPRQILLLQQSSRRYWQRPDVIRPRLDPTRASLSGTLAGVGHSKLAGAHWLWDLDYREETPGLEPNDLGAIGSVDSRSVDGDLRYRETVPRASYRSFDVGVEWDSEWSFEGIHRSASIDPFFNVELPNFWRVSVDAEFAPRAVSDRLTRGGPLMGTGRSRGARVEVRNSSGARVHWGVEAGADGDELGGWSRQIEATISIRPAARWELSIDPSWTQEESSRQFVAAIEDGPSATFGTRYVFAHVDRSEVAMQLRLNYAFTPRLSLETYAEPFASSGFFHSFGELVAPRSRSLRMYGTGGTTITQERDGTRTVMADGQTFVLEPEDFNVRSFRTNVVLRWEWRLGSTLVVVWQQDRTADRALKRVGPVDLWDALRASGDQIVALKATYWLPF